MDKNDGNFVNFLTGCSTTSIRSTLNVSSIKIVRRVT
jgi:hypothetical protein